MTNGPKDLDRTNGLGMSPLIAAVLGGSADTCFCLLKLGADPNFTHSTSLNSGSSQFEPVAGRFPAALHHAIFLGHRQIVDLLIEFKPEKLIYTSYVTAASTCCGSRTKNYPFSSNVSEDQIWVGSEGSRPSWWHFVGDSRKCAKKARTLFMAIKGDNPKAIDQLIAKGYKSDLPALIAAMHWQEPTLVICPHYVRFVVDEGCLEILKLLTDHGANVGNLYYDTTYNSPHWIEGPKTALQLAIQAHRASDEMAHYLIEKGADVTAPAHPHSGLSALQLAAMQGKITLARHLIKEGAQINAPRALRHGRTALEVAAGAGRLDMVQFLLNEGAETEGKGRVQYTHTMKMARRRGHAAVEKLLRRHRDRDMQDDILDAQGIIPDTGIPFVHPDETSFEERRDLRPWFIERYLEPPYDAELDLLSTGELELPLEERMNTLAMVISEEREIRRRANLFLGNTWGVRHYYGNVRKLIVATEVEIIRRNLPRTTPSTESFSPSDEDKANEPSIPCSDEDISNFFSQEEAIQKTEIFPLHEVAGAGEDIGPRIHFHPEFHRRRDSVDFHETMHDEFLI
ncbi:Ankyrin repeat domain-containing protein 50 [Apiospora phragmitis]|uniref:Ankyrin repeat domain-containing protein 50 n=1 Tax=Apiospora phragmitis TaxID=2905665 RepID=A0ABR1TB22_9PEZI